MLADEFAVGGDLPIEAVALSVSGIGSVDAYGAVHTILRDMPLIERFKVTQVSADTVSYEVDVRGGADRLRRALRFNGLIETTSAGPMQPMDTLEFFYED